jgi:hypothetical protein
MKAHRKNTCLQEIGLHLRDLLCTLSSIVKSIMKVSEKKICIRFRKLHTCTSNNHNQIIGGLNFCSCFNLHFVSTPQISRHEFDS